MWRFRIHYPIGNRGFQISAKLWVVASHVPSLVPNRAHVYVCVCMLVNASPGSAGSPTDAEGSPDCRSSQGNDTEPQAATFPLHSPPPHTPQRFIAWHKLILIADFLPTLTPQYLYSTTVLISDFSVVMKTCSIPWLLYLPLYITSHSTVLCYARVLCLVQDLPLKLLIRF